MPLVAQLQCCSARDGNALRQSAADTWQLLRANNLNDGSRPSPAVMAAVAISSVPVGQLLTMDERVKLMELAELAVERYLEKTNPPNKVGNLIAGILKEY